MLEKSILAKMPLPHEVQILIKKYLQVPTPTARLMKQVSFTKCNNRTIFYGSTVRIYELRGKWSAPPLLPEIQYLHRYRDDYSWRMQPCDRFTGDPIGVRRVQLRWPVLEPESLPTLSYYTREDADEMARRVRRWTPVSV